MKWVGRKSRMRKNAMRRKKKYSNYPNFWGDYELIQPYHTKIKTFSDIFFLVFDDNEANRLKGFIFLFFIYFCRSSSLIHVTC